ncbi:hypothetical protein I553_9333 [Mycobacterium xenopi 4042]|uniref:Uncharacterized protein n=1 Tax=Mycobacterium xenopi 4042 TaxID=1299334 RepID=X8DX14_MYCXE|nr:hypothetical protein I553_9333 [Mycobacterium xenopi 4042]
MALPVPDGLAADLVESLATRCLPPVPGCAIGSRPAGGLLAVDAAIGLALSSPPPRPVNALVDPHHLADSDPVWAGGDALRLRQVARAVTPRIAHPTLGLVNTVPGRWRVRCEPASTY